jgi:hypothetical protein
LLGWGLDWRKRFEVFGGRVVFHGGFSSRGSTPRRRDPRPENMIPLEDHKNVERRFFLFHRPVLGQGLDLRAQDPDQLEGLLLLIGYLPEL